MKQPIRSIEGFRALAFIAVTLYHLYPYHLPGGFLGVVTFFVMAGFFMSLPFARGEAKPLLSLYRSRFFKLMPPIIFLVLGVSAWTYFVQPQIFSTVVTFLPSTLLGVNNYKQLLSGTSYFDLHGNFNPFVHLWALSVEMQFYLFYPLLLKRMERVSRTTVIKILSALTLVSTLYMVGAYLIKGPGFAYYSSLARLMSFSAASLFAFLYVSITKRASWNFGAKTPLQILLFLLLIFSMFVFKGDSAFLYLGGFLLYSILASLFLGLLYHDQGLVARLLHWRPLQVIARRTYSLYLWQYAIMVLFAQAFAHSTLPYSFFVLLQLLVVFVVAEFSYRFLELKRKPLLVPVFLLLALFSPILLPQLPSTALDEMKVDLQFQADELQRQKRVTLQQEYGDLFNDYVQVKIVDGELAIQIPSILRQPDKDPDLEWIKESNIRYPEHTISLWDYQKKRKTQGIALGDSVMITGGVKLQELLPNLLVDAALSRQFYECPQLLENYLEQNPRIEVILIGLGSNGITPLDKDVEKLLEVADGRKILLVNIVSPESYETHINTVLKEYAEKHPEITLVDWYSLAKHRGEFFYEDSTHLHPVGGEFYTHILLEAILKAST